MLDFTHLHVHTEYSVLDGASKIKTLVKRAKEIGQTALAITDHRNMFGCIPFYKACVDEGIKPIIGMEANICQSVADKDKGFHLILLVKNEAGYKNLCELATFAYNNIYQFPRIDKEFLSSHHEGLICTSACIAGEIPTLIDNDNYDEAKKVALWYKSLFGEDFYLEVQNHGIPAELNANLYIRRLSKELDIKIIATNDAHYVRKEDAETQDILLCLQTGSKLSDPNRFKFSSDEFYLKSADEMLELFPNDSEYLTNTSEIVNKCNFQYEFGITRLPVYDIPTGYNSHIEYLRELAEQGIASKYGVAHDESIDQRLEHELFTINKMGYTDYFLIVWDYINWSHNHGVTVGPGRGSGAGSIVAYAIGITDIDPIRYDLYFERFLNPERVSMPDFDIDFCVLRREETIDYVIEKYSESRVSRIMTFNMMQGREAIKGSARVLDLPIQLANKLSSFIHNNKIDEALNEDPEFQEMVKTNKDAALIIDKARKIEGYIKSVGTHAAGILICDKPITNYAPLMIDKNGKQVVQGTMLDVESLGLLKFDFLGLRNLTIIQNTLDMIRNNTGTSYDMNKIDMQDKAVYSMMASGDTKAVFQFESDGIASVLKELVPTNIEDLIAVNALYRPGPMDEIPKFIRNKKNPQGIQYLDPKLEPILKETYGCIVYQEQVMRIFQVLAGFSLGRADIVRRAMSKKKKAVIEEEKRNFIYGLKDEDGNTVIEGALARNVSEETCNTLMDQISAFASYAFNKAHAAAYSVIAYRTAWLKCHFPHEFMCATMDSLVYGGKGADTRAKYLVYIQEGLKMQILPPDINKSYEGFVKEGTAIRYGFTLLKNVGTSAAAAIVKEREENGVYTSLYNLCKRCKKYKVDKGALEALICAGALDGFAYNRKELMEALPIAIDTAKKDKSDDDMNLTFFDIKSHEPEITKCSDFSPDEKSSMEFDFAHMYITSNPLDCRRKNINAINIPIMDNIVDKIINSPYPTFKDNKGRDAYPTETFVGIITELKKGVSKKGNWYARFVLRGSAITIPCVSFSYAVEKFNDAIENNKCVVVKGKYNPQVNVSAPSDDESDSSDISVEFIINEFYAIPLDDTPDSDSFIKTFAENSSIQQTKLTDIQPQTKAEKSSPKYTPGLYLGIQKHTVLADVVKIILQFPGSTPVVFCDYQKNRMFKAEGLNIDTAAYDVLASMVGEQNIKLIK